MFGKCGDQMRLAQTSYYYNAQSEEYKERMHHKKKAMNVDVFAGKLVNDILSGARSPIWRGAFASHVRYMTWVFPTWCIDKLRVGQYCKGFGAGQTSIGLTRKEEEHILSSRDIQNILVVP